MSSAGADLPRGRRPVSGTLPAEVTNDAVFSCSGPFVFPEARTCGRVHVADRADRSSNRITVAQNPNSGSAGVNSSEIQADGAPNLFTIAAAGNANTVTVTQSGESSLNTSVLTIVGNGNVVNVTQSSVP